VSYSFSGSGFGSNSADLRVFLFRRLDIIADRSRTVDQELHCRVFLLIGR